ncbi:MAG: ATP-binding protein [Pseudomonadota bacterium]
MPRISPHSPLLRAAAPLLVAALTLLTSTSSLAQLAPADQAPASLDALNELTSTELKTALAKARGVTALRARLLLAQRYTDTPAQAQAYLTAAAPALALRQIMDTAGAGARATEGVSPTVPELAIADALLCRIHAGSRGTYGDAQACASLGRYLTQESNPFARGIIFMARANEQMFGGDLTAALADSRLAIDAAFQSASRRLRARALTQRGWLLQQYGLPQPAVTLYGRARAQVGDDDIQFITALSQLTGMAQLAAGYPEAALKGLIEGLGRADENGQTVRSVRLRDLIAQAYLAQGKPTLARRYLSGIFAGPVPELPTATQISALATLASTEQALGNSARANALFDQALAIAEQAGDSAGRDATERRYGAALLEQGQAQAALKLLEPLVERLAEREPTTHLAHSLDIAASAYAATGDYASAFAAARRSQRTAAGLQNASFERQLSYQRSELELDQRSLELSASRAREASLRSSADLKTAVLTAVLLLGVIGGLLAYLGISRRLQRQKAQVQEQAARELESVVIARTQELETELANRLLLQEERRQLEATLAEGDKLRSIGQLTSGVAHDFNNLMTVVSLSAEMLRQDGAHLTLRQQQCVEDILLAADSAARVTSGLLAYARQQPQEPEQVDLHEFLAQAEPLLRRTLEEGIELTLRCEDERPNAKADPGKPFTALVDRANLTTAIINLLMNAREAMGHRGEVELLVTAGAEFIELAVSDSGPGMTETQRVRATEPFYTTKGGGKGSGLGLSMVFGFARQSGGDLRLEASAAGGTRAVIALPRAQADAVLVAVPERPLLAPLTGSARVLLVEDQHALRATLCRMLENLGLEVIEQENADQAAGWVARLGLPDLLLSDIVMPGQRNGIELADELRALDAKLPVLLMSGYTELLDISYPLLRKPFAFGELERRVREVLGARVSAGEVLAIVPESAAVATTQ